MLSTELAAEREASTRFSRLLWRTSIFSNAITVRLCLQRHECSHSTCLTATETFLMAKSRSFCSCPQSLDEKVVLEATKPKLPPYHSTAHQLGTLEVYTWGWCSLITSDATNSAWTTPLLPLFNSRSLKLPPLSSEPPFLHLHVDLVSTSKCM